MNLEKELNKFWNWFGMSPNEYPDSSANGELESEYPGWEKIYLAAEHAIEKLNDRYDRELAELLIQSLAIDNECENILEIIKEKLIPISEFYSQVAISKQDQARWQLAEILGHKNSDESLNMLVQLINKDRDTYVQRRALISLRTRDLKQAKIESEKFINSSDSNFKRIALGIKNEN